MKPYRWHLPRLLLPGLLLLAATPALAAADSTTLQIRLRVVSACELPPASVTTTAACSSGVPQVRSDAAHPAAAAVRSLTPPTPQPGAREADFTTFTF